MIVITRNGQRTVITGWRAWLIAGPIMLVVAVVLVALALVIVGVALSIATIMMFAVPLVLVLLFAATLFGPRR